MKKILLIASLVLLAGAGCSSQVPQETKQPELSDTAAAPVVNIFEHTKFGFTFMIPLGVVAKMDANGNDVHFVDAVNGVERATMVVQPGIPDIPLAKNKIEKIVVDGIVGQLYHDTDQADGGKVDKLIVDFPLGSNRVYISAPEIPGTTQVDVKAIAGTWNWKK